MSETKTHSFEITVDTSDFQGAHEAIDTLLFEAGLADSLVSWRGGILFVQFDRVSSSLDEAIDDATAQINSVDGLPVDGCNRRTV